MVCKTKKLLQCPQTLSSRELVHGGLGDETTSLQGYSVHAVTCLSVEVVGGSSSSSSNKSTVLLAGGGGGSLWTVTSSVSSAVLGSRIGGAAVLLSSVVVVVVVVRGSSSVSVGKVAGVGSSFCDSPTASAVSCVVSCVVSGVASSSSKSIGGGESAIFLERELERIDRGEGR